MIKALKESALRWLSNIDLAERGEHFHVGTSECALCRVTSATCRFPNGTKCYFVEYYGHCTYSKEFKNLIKATKRYDIIGSNHVLCQLLAMYMHEVTK